MKVALCSSYVPFIQGGARNIVDWLEVMLRRAGHQTEKVYLPHVDSPDAVMGQMLAYRWVDLTETADRIICFRPPAHVIPHPNKILWFIHHIRSFYDLWDTPYRGFPDDARHRQLRSALHAADTQALGEARAIFTNSEVVSQRLLHYNGVSSKVLYPPVFEPERFHCRGFNDEVVYICRIEHHKRQHLLVDAMRHTRTPVRLRLCGSTSEPEYVQRLRDAIASAGLQSRVALESEWISEARKVDLLADCLAAAYIPLDEDSYGYPSLEASHAAKAVLTTDDAGGVLELVQDGRNGLVVPPSPHDLGEALDRLFVDRAAAQRMGHQARARLQDLDIGWDHVLAGLLA